MTDEFISREATIKRIKEVYCVGCNSYHGVRCRACGTGDAIDMIEDAPAADVAPVVHGRWISKNPHGYEWTFVCSNCGYVDGYPFNDRHNYCPNCGANMESEE